MNKTNVGNAVPSGLKQSLARKCLAYLGGISIIRPMVAMLLIVVLLSSATAINAQQIEVSKQANKYIQIGAKVMSAFPSPYTKILGGAVGFLFAPEEEPSWEDRKASLAKEWKLDIDNKSKENYKTFINARKVAYLRDLDLIAVAERRSPDEAMDQARVLAGIVRTDIPLFHENSEKKPYPAGPTLPFLHSAMGFNLGLIKMQIEWGQQNINKAVAEGDAKAITAARGRRDALVEQYNKQLVSFWKLLQKEIVRAKKERGEQVKYLEVTMMGAISIRVSDEYYGLDTTGIKYQALGIANRYLLSDLRWGIANRSYVDTLKKAHTQISKETNSYDLMHYGFYNTTFDNRAPLLYTCSETIKATRAGKAGPIVPSLHLVCPVPGGGIDEVGELASNKIADGAKGQIARLKIDQFGTDETGDITRLLTENWTSYPQNGSLLTRNEDGTFGLTLGVPDMGSQTVTNTNDNGPGSLRQAIEDGGRIDVTAIQGQTITLTSGPLYIYARDVKIMADNLRQPIKIVGQRGDKIFVVSGDAKFYNDRNTNLYNLLDVDGKDLKCGVNPSVRENAPKVTTCPGVLPKNSNAAAKTPIKTPPVTTTPPAIAAARTNVALASNGGVASASSTIFENLPNYPSYPPSSAINGDRTASKWSGGGGWNDATTSEFPDWLQVDFSGKKNIDEITVVTLQDGYGPAGVPTAETKFTKEGIKDFVVQYWNGTDWVAVPDGTVKGNDLVIRTFKFTPVSTTKIRVTVTAALQDYSRIVQLEAWGKN